MEFAGDIALRARLWFPAGGTPQEDVWLAIRAGRVVAVDSRPAADLPRRDLGSAAVLPPLVNAHAHLEFSDLLVPLGSPGMSLPDWIRLVVARRKQAMTGGGASGAKGSGTLSTVEAAITQGLQALEAGGVQGVGEIASSHWSAAPFGGTSMACVPFCELIGQSDARVDAEMHRAKAFIDQGNLQALRSDQARGVATPFPRFGLSPHAPYSASLELVRRSVALAKERGLPVAMHVAESSEEVEYLAGGGGAFRVLLEELGAWSKDAAPGKLRPLNFLELLASAPRSLIVHGNYLDDDELAFLGAHPRNMTLVYCPRTHAWFGHRPYRLSKALELGVTLALGTDSRASNPDLNFWEDVRFAATHHDVPPREILAMATTGGAHALGALEGCSAAIGSPARFSMIELPPSASGGPYEVLFAPGSRPREEGG